MSDSKVLIPDFSKRVTVIDHPMVQHKLTLLRDKRTGTKMFHDLIKELAIFLGYEATRDFKLAPITVETHICATTAYALRDRKIAVVPILRAGLGMVDGLLDLIPTACVGHIGLFRDPATHKPIEYYCKLPDDIKEHEVLILDPMLATGGSASAAVELLKSKGVPSKSIRLLVVIAAPEGIQAVVAADPLVSILTCAIDECLNENAYIVPGLGDAGDRIFGT